MSEDPKTFLRTKAPAPDKVYVISPIQDREDEFYNEERLHCSMVVLHGKDFHKLPSHIRRSEADFYDDGPTVEWDDVYVYEILAWCLKNNVEVIEAWADYPEDGIMVDAWMDHERRQMEAEDPKYFIKRVAAPTTIWPSENYYLNMWKEEESWKDGNFTPCQVNDKNEMMLFDANYGLVDDIYAALGVNHEPNEAEEEQFSQEEDRYWEPIHADLKRGITSGSVEGIAGRYRWQLVYDASRDKDADDNRREPFDAWADQVQPVRAGQQYGTRITPKTDRTQWRAFGGDVDPMAEALAQTILDGEDPKRIFKQMQGPEPKYRVTIRQYNRKRKDHDALGAFDIDVQSGKISNVRFSPRLKQPPSEEDYADIRSSLLRWGHGMAGHYPKASPYPGTYHWSAEPAADLNRYRPMLVVEGPGWVVRGPLMKSQEYEHYIWRFSKLTPEQHHILKQYGEFIHYAMNEGDAFRGEHSNEDTWENEFNDETPGYQPTGPVTIKWHVVGNPQLAPYGSWEGTDWSGLAPGLP